jgi:hypothetical protein
MMKKIFALFVFTGYCLSLYAQTFDFGIKGGINSSKIITGSSTGTNSYTLSDLRSDVKTGYNIGAFMRLGGKKLYLQPEFLYTVKKASNEMNLNGNENFATPVSSQSFDLKSLQVPLLLGYKLINLKIVSLRVFTGPAMSVILDNSQIKLTNSGSVVVDPSVYDPKNFKKNVWDWQAGGGLDIGNLVLDVRYEWGLTNVSELNPGKIGFNNKGNTFTFSVGFKIF